MVSLLLQIPMPGTFAHAPHFHHHITAQFCFNLWPDNLGTPVDCPPSLPKAGRRRIHLASSLTECTSPMTTWPALLAGA